MRERTCGDYDDHDNDFDNGVNEGCEDLSYVNKEEAASLCIDVDYEDGLEYIKEVPILLDLVHWGELPSFGNEISNTYFEQDFKMFHEHGELNGGLQGACWRSRYRLNLYSPTHLASMGDTMLMFNITNLLSKNPASSNNLLYEIIDDLLGRMLGDFDSNNPQIRILRNHNDAVRSCLEGTYGIFNNLHCPLVHHVGGHACMKIGDVISQHMASG